MTVDATGRLAMWEQWLTRVQDDLVRAHWHQKIWTEFRDAFTERYPEADASLLLSYSQVYAAAQMATIRRIADRHRDAGSLGTLIAALRDNPTILTRAVYVARRREEERASDDWFAHWASPETPDQLNTALLTADLDRLAGEVQAIKLRVDKTIAHLDRQIESHAAAADVLPTVTYADIRAALAFLGELSNRYSALLLSSTYGMWEPVIEGDWKAPLRGSLFPSSPTPDWPQHATAGPE